MTAQIVRGNALALPLAAESVDLVVTSPPYFGLRSYQDGGRHYDGQIGSEATPSEFIDALLAATREMVRVLKPSGSIWVNLGDKYASPGGHTDHGTSSRLQGRRAVRQQGRPERKPTGIPPKSLVGVPWRYALRCIDDLGLILRAEVIWSKPNGLPESVTDRVRRSHETWFHFTRGPRYFSAVDEIREVHAAEPKRSGMAKLDGRSGQAAHTLANPQHPLGKLPGSVWEIPTQPLTVPAHLGVDHFAAFPMEWPRRIIRGWSPSGICTACGEGRRPVTVVDEVERTAARDALARRQRTSNVITGGTARTALGVPAQDRARAIVGESCGCPDTSAPTTPAVVLDPFGGTGTTALVADILGRHGISVDMSADYCRLAQWRTTDPGERARAMQVERPPAVLDGQLELFGGAR